ncbi:MAG: hypothetical protein WCD20_18225 [Rhodomicrobium sp.]
MAPDIDKVEAIFRQHWQIPSDLSRNKLHALAFRTQVMVGQKYSHDNLKYQISLIQTEMLAQKLDDLACDQIASELLRDTNA